MQTVFTIILTFSLLSLQAQATKTNHVPSNQQKEFNNQGEQEDYWAQQFIKDNYVKQFSFLLILTSCLPSKVVNTADYNISLTKVECGSYAVKNHSDTIGYTVKPLYFFSDRSTGNIANFEKLLRSTYGSRYDKFKRQYWFTATRAHDTLIFVTMLSRREMNLVPDWKCEEQEVDIYNKIFRHVGTKTFPRSFSFNCNKDRWTLPGED